MKKSKLLLLVLFCIVALSFSSTVNAALTTKTIDVANSMLEENSIVLTSDYSQVHLGGVVSSHGDFTMINEQFGEGHHGYITFKVRNADPNNDYVTMRYNYIGYVNSGENKGRKVGADMTIGGLRMGNGNNNYYLADSNKHGGIGFNRFYMGFILFEADSSDGILHRGSVAKITIRFFLKNSDGTPETNPDGSVKYMNVGSMYIGIGGFNSEKKFTNNPAETDSVLGAPQWEWVSFDNTQGVTEGFYDSSALIKYYPAGYSGIAVDNDPGETDYGWGVGPAHSYNEGTTNQTGRSVVSNGGNRYPEILEVMADDMNLRFNNYSLYRQRLAQGFWMFKVPTVTENGNTFSQFQFEFGKSFGTVELGINPILLTNHFPGKPEKTVDKAKAHEQEELTYTITQKTGFLQSNAGNNTALFDEANTVRKYNSMSIEDDLPGEVTLNASSVVVKTGNTILRNGADYNLNGTSGNHLVVNFTRDYLQNRMAYRGEEYVVTFKATVNDLTYTRAQQLANGTHKIFVAPNKSKTIIDGSNTSWSNEVQTQILFDILTKGVNTIISDKIVDIEGGTSGHEVTFKPELGYYVETVEWQNQSPRYDLATTPDIPLNNKKRIPETKDGSESSYLFVETMDNSEGGKLNYDPFGETTYTFNEIDNNHYVKVQSAPMKMVIQIDKIDNTTGGKTRRGDCKFVNAQYTVYSNYDEATGVLSNPVDIITLDENGYGESAELDLQKKDADGKPYGEYFIKETKAPEGYLLDETVYKKSITAEQQTANREKVSYHHITSPEEPWKNRLEVIKYDDNKDSTEEKSSKGAILRLTLDSSDGAKYYDATINEDGYAEFVDEELMDYYPYTIPYGRYTVTEVRPSDEGYHTRFYIQPEHVNLTKGHEKLNYRIFADYEIEAYLKVIKKDTDTNEEVHIAGAKYKIWDVRDKKWVSQIVSPSGEHISEFETNAKGYFITPEKLHAGKYVVYETVAPEGYYLNDELRIPKNEADLGDATKAGVEVTIDSVATGLTNPEDLIYDQDRELMVEMDVYNTPLKAELDIKKTGEMLTEVKTSEVTYKTGANQTAKEEKYTPVYKMQGLPGVTYNIVAATDIKSPDKRFTYVTAGTIVDTVTTGDDGIAKTKALYPGEYEVKETNTPKGYLINTSIPNVELKSENSLVAVQVTNKEYTNVRQKLGFTFDKVFTDVDYSNSDTLEQKALFGVYTKEAIANYKGNTIIPANKLVAFCEVDEDGDVTTPVDLPEGKYEVRELWASYPYTVSSKTTSYELKYNEDKGQEFLVVEGETFENDYERASLTMIKLPSTIVDNVVLDGEYIDKTELDDKAKEVIEKIKTMTEEEVKEYFEENGIESIPGAKYVVYTDEECTNELRIKNKETGRFEIAELVTNETGIIKLNNLPLGEYYVKEVEAPVGYQLSEEVVKVVLDTTNKDAMVYQALIEDCIVEQGVSKVDLVTGEAIPKCTFAITDEEGQTILRSITDEKGYAWIPVALFEDGKTYTYKEIDAPKMYELNEEGFEFVAKFDEEGNLNIDKQKVYNTRKTREVIVRKLDAKTGDPLEGCVFTIAMIDEKTGEQKVNAETGEPIYLVENATTNKDGEYVIEKAPMGTYKFMEIKAPEGYELDEDLTGLTFTIDNSSPETIIFEVTNTGDIAVIALSIIAIVSVMGIVYVLRRKVANKNI